MSAKRKLAFINGKIFTSDDRFPYADTMVVEDGIITWIGSREEADLSGCDITDLDGKRILPGFVDAHMHPVILSEYSRQISCLPPRIRSLEELIEEIRRVRETQAAGEWIQGWGYDEGKFPEKRLPNRHDLDRGCSDSPVLITRTCCHILCVNSRALRLASITRDTPDPEGGQIDRDETGEPTGILRENARYLIQSILPEITHDQSVRYLLDLGELLTSQGVTAVSDLGVFGATDTYALYREAAEKGFLQKVGVYYIWDFYRKDPDFTIPPERLRRDQQIHMAGIKLLGDGSVSGRTAWMAEPYLDSEDCGLPVCSDEEIETAIAFCKKNHCQLAIHAMGGRAIDRIVDRVYPEEPWITDDTPYLRVEHVTEPSPFAIKKAAEKGFGFATQPIFPYCEIESYLANLGPERTKKTYPVRTMLEQGVGLCFSTDAPSTSWALPSDPLPCIKGAVTRYAYDGTDIGQDERVDIETAIRLYTRESARIASFAKTGCLAPGYQADFIVLNEDILQIPPERIDEIKIEKTYIGGELRFERNIG